MLTYIPSAGAEPFADTFPLITDLSKTGSERTFTLLDHVRLESWKEHWVDSWKTWFLTWIFLV